jgi:hypothetical protein
VLVVARWFKDIFIIFFTFESFYAVVMIINRLVRFLEEKNIIEKLCTSGMKSEIDGGNNRTNLPMQRVVRKTTNSTSRAVAAGKALHLITDRRPVISRISMHMTVA